MVSPRLPVRLHKIPIWKLKLRRIRMHRRNITAPLARIAIPRDITYRLFVQIRRKLHPDHLAKPILRRHKQHPPLPRPHIHKRVLRVVTDRQIPQRRMSIRRPHRGIDMAIPAVHSAHCDMIGWPLFNLRSHSEFV